MASDLEFADFDAVAGDGDDLVVTATIANGADEHRDGTVAVTVTAGDDEFERSQSVSVPAGESVDVELDFDVPYAQFEESGDLSLDVS